MVIHAWSRLRFVGKTTPKQQKVGDNKERILKKRALKEYSVGQASDEALRNQKNIRDMGNRTY